MRAENHPSPTAIIILDPFFTSRIMTARRRGAMSKRCGSSSEKKIYIDNYMQNMIIA